MVRRLTKNLRNPGLIILIYSSFIPIFALFFQKKKRDQGDQQDQINQRN